MSSSASVAVTVPTTVSAALFSGKVYAARSVANTGALLEPSRSRSVTDVSEDQSRPDIAHL